MIELNDAITALKAADAAGNVEDARKLAGIVQELSRSKSERPDAAKIVRGVAAPITGFGNSVAEAMAAPAELAWAGARKLGLSDRPAGQATETLKKILMPGRRFEAETDTERTLQAAGHGAGDAAAFMVPGAAAAKFTRAGSAPQRLGQFITQQPGMQVAAGAAGGAVTEATDSPWLGLGAAVGVPLGVAGVQGAASLTQKGLQAAFPGASDEVVTRNVGKTFENVDINQARKRLTDLTAAKEPVSLFQLGDESTKRLARATAGAPGEGGNIAAARLKEQRAGMSGRVQEDVAGAFKGKDAFRQEQLFLDRLRTNADDAYGKFRENVPYVWSDDLAEMLKNRPSLKEAIGIAMRNAAEEGKPFGITKKNGSIMMADDFQKGEEIKALTSSAVDDIKKALDGIIDANKNEFTGKLNNYGRLVTQTKERFLGAVEDADQSGLYKAARSQYAGDAEVIQALRDGRDFAKMDPREIQQFMAKASFAEKDAFRSGMQDAIEKSIKQTKGDKTKALFRKDEWTDEQLKAALDPKDYKILKRRIDARKQTWEDVQFVSSRSGSQTQLRGADADSMENNTLDAVGDVLKGNSIKTAIASKIMEPLMRRYQGVTEQSAPVYANKLFEGDPNKIRDMLLQIELARTLAQQSPRAGLPASMPGAAGAQLLPMLTGR